MVGRYVMTENELTGKRPTPESVGMGSYTIDSHNVQRYITPEGYVQNEGDIGVAIRPYTIAYGSLVPRDGQADNLLVPVCVSSSHIAFGSIRMEPVFMILGQSAATAAVMAIDTGVPVQKVDYVKLRARLLADGQVLEFDGAREQRAAGIDPKILAGVVVDDAQAAITGTSSAVGPFVGAGYRHDANAGKGQKIARFAAKLAAGRYEVRIAYSPNANRANNVPLAIQHAGGVKTVQLDQRRAPAIDGLWFSAGIFEFPGDRPAVVEIGNAGTTGHVVIDAVQFLPQGKDAPR